MRSTLMLPAIWILMSAPPLGCAQQDPPPTSAPTTNASPADEPSAQEVFEANAAALQEPGVRVIGGYTFACACRDLKPSGDIAERWARSEALGAIAEHRVAQALQPATEVASARGRVLAKVAQSLRATPQELSGVTTIDTRKDGGKCCVVLAIPTPPPLKLDGLLQEVIADLRARLSSGQGAGLSGPEALLLLELDPKALESPMRESVLDCLDRQVGDGFSATVEGRWSGRSGEPLKNGLEDWCAEAASGRSRDASTWSTMKREERLRALGHRAGDPRLSSMVAEDLMGDGWGRAADLLKSARPASAVPASSADSGLRPEVRAMALGTPAVMAMVLSDGADPRALSGGRQSSDDFKAATESFNGAKPEGLNEAVERLTQILAKPDGRTADVPSLLSASLTNLGEPALAIPIARAAFRSGRDHRYAGVNLVLALQKAGRREELAAVLPEVEKCPNLDDWGRQQLQAARAWLKP